MNKYIVIIKVYCKKGEDYISVNDNVSDLDLNILKPLIESLKEHKGFFPTGDFVDPNKPSAIDLYRDYQGWDIFRSMLPEPLSGIQSIIEFSIYNYPIIKLSMI